MNPNEINPELATDHQIQKSIMDLQQTETFRPSKDTDPVQNPIAEEFPSIDGYQIDRLIATGGMGCVYQGREIALDREVAIKTLLPKANSERFLIESKITAKLPHPNIPAVYQIGTLDSGAPFLAMKLVQGETLDKLLKNRTEETANQSKLIQIFEQIAQAVGFAHSKGVVHRDLKPLNVMIGAFGEVQVMDWGLAKDNSAEITLTSDLGQTEAHLTHAGTIMGTPKFMSPEQARGEAVDARSDVFALGAILTVILTGKSVFEAENAKATIAMAAAGNTQPAVERLQACGADQGLIDIALDCLEVNPEDRPPHAGKVATAVRNYQRSVEKQYRKTIAEKAAAATKEQERRVRGKILRYGTSALVIILVAGIIGTTIGMVRANQARAQEDIQKKRAIANAQEAQEEAITTRATLDFLQRDFFQISSARGQHRLEEGKVPINPDITLKEAVLRATNVINGRFTNQPKVEAELRTTLANTLDEIGEKEIALENAKKGYEVALKAFGPHHQMTLYVRTTVARLSNLPLDAFEKECKEILALQQQYLSDFHQDTLFTHLLIADCFAQRGEFTKYSEIVQWVYKTQVAQFGEHHPTTVYTFKKITDGNMLGQDLDQILSSLNSILDHQTSTLGADHPDLIETYQQLATISMLKGSIEKASNYSTRTIDIAKKNYGEKHAITRLARCNSSELIYASDKINEYLPIVKEICNEAIELDAPISEIIFYEKKLLYGYTIAKNYQEVIERSPELVMTCQNHQLHADCLEIMWYWMKSARSLKNDDEANRIKKEALDYISIYVQNPNFADRFVNKFNTPDLPIINFSLDVDQSRIPEGILKDVLVLIQECNKLPELISRKRYAEAAKTLDNTLQTIDEKFPYLSEQFQPQSEYLVNLYSLAGLIDFKNKNFSSALRHQIRSREIIHKIHGDSHLLYAEQIQAIGVTQIQLMQQEESYPNFVKAYEIRKKQLPESDPLLLESTRDMAWVLEQQNKHGDALQYRLVCLKSTRQILGESNPAVLQAMKDVIAIYQLLKESELELDMQRQLVEWARIHLPENDDKHMYEMRELAIKQFHAGQQEDAFSNFQTAHCLRELAFGKADPRTLESLRDVAWLHEVQDNFQDAYAIYQEVYSRWLGVRGAADENTLLAACEFANFAERCSQYSVAKEVFESNLMAINTLPEKKHTFLVHRCHAWSLGLLGFLEAREKNYDAAIKHLENSLALIEKHQLEQNSHTASEKNRYERLLKALMKKKQPK
ncbi:MAG: serine/threonine-protein kinase [Zavarzinella sp.]